MSDIDANIGLPEDDHRVIGKKLNLFAIDPLVGQGLVLWLPAGAIIRTELQNFMQEQLKRLDYLPVFTPHIGNIELYKKSGHYPYYKDNQFPPIEFIDEDGSSPCACSNCGRREEVISERYLLKPMNCPHHCMIFKAVPRSYRELPLRLAEFGTVYRYESAGSLNGLMRVRGLTQDDAHIFCSHDQVEKEISDTLMLTQAVLEGLGFSDYRVVLSVRDDSEKYVGDPIVWEKAEATLRDIVSRFPYEEQKGEAAFYGPKIDFMVKDAGGRERQLGTVQLDYVLPERFDLSYTGNDGKPHRPVMIHRAPFGSFERFIGMLIEHFKGDFPLWLSPTQVRVVNITEPSIAGARNVLSVLKSHGIRIDHDIGMAGNIKGKVKDFEEGNIPYLAVVGKREADTDTVSIRRKGSIALGVMRTDDFVKMVLKEIKDRSL